MAETSQTFFENLAVGQKYLSAEYVMTETSMKLFASEFDPQRFHLDHDFATGSLFAGLAASGWHTAAVTMRLFVQRLNFAGGAVGLGVDGLKWPEAVRVGDKLKVETEILELRESRSLVNHGVLKFRNVTYNGDGKIVQTFIASALVAKRQPSVG